MGQTDEKHLKKVIGKGEKKMALVVCHAVIELNLCEFL
jgi:hypothetical protein